MKGVFVIGSTVYFVYDNHVSSCSLSEAYHTTTTAITVSKE